MPRQRKSQPTSTAHKNSRGNPHGQLSTVSNKLRLNLSNQSDHSIHDRPKIITAICPKPYRKANSEPLKTRKTYLNVVRTRNTCIRSNEFPQQYGRQIKPSYTHQ